MKDPAFLFYPGDWLGGTMTMTRAHKGAYMDVLMAQFNSGHLSISDIKIILGADFDLMWESVLKKKFSEDSNGLFYNDKLEREIIKRRNYSNSRKANLSGKSNHHVDIHMNSHMENGNEIGNKDDSENGFESEIESINGEMKKYSEDFELMWAIYPKKIGKGDAYKAWKKIKPSGKLYIKIMQAINKQIRSIQWKKDNGQFIPNFSTWLNQSRWDDDLPISESENQKPKLKNPCPLELPASRWKYIDSPMPYACPKCNTVMEMYISVYEHLEIEDFYNLRWWCPNCGVEDSVLEKFYPPEHKLKIKNAVVEQSKKFGENERK